MQERSEDEIINRLLTLENDGVVDRRTELTGERYLSLIHDPDSGRAYTLRHGLDSTEGAQVPPETEFFEYPTLEEAERAYEAQLAEHRAAGEVVEEDSEEDVGDFETGGAELRDWDVDDAGDDPLVREPMLQDDLSEEEDEPGGGAEPEIGGNG